MKEETIHFHFLLDESRFSDMCTTMEYRETYNFFQETPFGKFQVIWPCRTSFMVFIENTSKSNWIQPSGL